MYVCVSLLDWQLTFQRGEFLCMMIFTNVCLIWHLSYF